jgi:hypothetical protein
MCGHAGCSQNALEGKTFCLEHHKSQDKYAYGLDHELANKIAAKWDAPRAQLAIHWIEQVLGRSDLSNNDFQGILKSGEVLCHLVNKLWPGSVKSVSKSNAPFVQRENITAYLNACRQQGLKEIDLFVTADLYEGNNLLAVLDNICAVAHQAKQRGWKGAQLNALSDNAAPRSAPIALPTTNTTNNLPSAIKPSDVAQTSPSVSSSGNKFCGDCGKARVGAAKFCGECGHAF